MSAEWSDKACMELQHMSFRFFCEFGDHRSPKKLGNSAAREGMDELEDVRTLHWFIAY